MDAFFTMMLKVQWLQNERFRAGILSLLKECTSAEQLTVIQHVLEKLRYCTSKDTDMASINAADVILKTWALPADDTIIVGLAENNRTCGSTAYLRAIEINLPRSWKESIWPPFDATFRHRDGKKNLVIVDDFIGTGEKVSTRIGRIRRNPKTSDYNIFVVAFAAMSEGLQKVGADVNGAVHTHLTLDKSIAVAAPAKEQGVLYESMQLLEERIFEKPGKYSLGYMGSEAAFFLEGANIPNNNFPILWWDKYANDTDRPTLFRRR